MCSGSSIRALAQRALGRRQSVCGDQCVRQVKPINGTPTDLTRKAAGPRALLLYFYDAAKRHVA